MRGAISKSGSNDSLAAEESWACGGHRPGGDAPMHDSYWLDIGNNAASGQYVLGQPLNSRNRRAGVRLRTVSELYPEIVDAVAGEDPLPSCSAIEALDRQLY